MRLEWLPTPILTRTADLVATAGLGSVFELDETLLHASVDPQTETNLRGWLENFAPNV